MIDRIWCGPIQRAADIKAPKSVGGHPSGITTIVEEIKLGGHHGRPDVAIKLPRILRLDRQRRDRLHLEACQEVEKCVGHVNTRDGKSEQILSPSAQKPQAR